MDLKIQLLKSKLSSLKENAPYPISSSIKFLSATCSSTCSNMYIAKSSIFLKFIFLTKCSYNISFHIIKACKKRKLTYNKFIKIVTQLIYCASIFILLDAICALLDHRFLSSIYNLLKLSILLILKAIFN